MEEHLINPLAVTHLLQHTLRSLCIHENSQWVYAVFWRILPRNYPPPKWDSQGGAYDRSRGNRRNWILVWEDGFCNFAASVAAAAEMNNSDGGCRGGDGVYGEFQHFQGLQPELFFKMSHEIYNYGEGLIGKVAADHSHKWVYKEPNDQEINFLSAWHNSPDSHPRTWEAQFQSGIKTIALIAVREGVVQLGSVHKVIEDLSYVVLLRKKLSYIESIPGVLLPHPSSSSSPSPSPSPSPSSFPSPEAAAWHFHQLGAPPNIGAPTTPQELFYHDHFNNQPTKITPSMSSLEALLSKLPSVVPPSGYCQLQQQPPLPTHLELMIMKEEAGEKDDARGGGGGGGGGESSSSMAAAAYRRGGQQHYYHQQQQHHHQDMNVVASASRSNNGY